MFALDPAHHPAYTDVLGQVNSSGDFYHIAFNNPLEFVDGPPNQDLFTVRTEDIQSLLFYAPLFRQAMHGPYWKFRMAVQMHEAGHFQNTEWEVRFFLWTCALESLYTSKTPGIWREHSGSTVASERIKFLLGGNTPIYPPGELMSLQPNPGLTIGDVIGEIYCLRNHIAHGDKVSDYYFQQSGRQDLNGPLPRCMVLTEAISFIVRQSLLRILRDGLLNHFDEAPNSEAYFASNNLTKSVLQKAGIQHFGCPT